MNDLLPKEATLSVIGSLREMLDDRDDEITTLKALMPRWVSVDDCNPTKAKWYAVMIEGEDDQNTGYFDMERWENPSVLYWLDKIPPHRVKGEA